MPPIISALVFTKTDTTVAATWTTDIAANSNIFAGSKAGVDNGVAANGTAHAAIVAGLLPQTTYSCTVSSSGTTSTPQNVTTNAAATRIQITAASNGAVTLGSASNNYGDTQRTFLSNDGNVYIVSNDGKGFVAATPNAGFSINLAALSNEVNMTGGATLIAAPYGALAATNGTDGPGLAAMTNKTSGHIGLNGNLHVFCYRQFPPTYTTNRYCNWIKSTDHGATWNNFNAPSTFVALGNPVTPNSPAEPVQFYDLTIGLVVPVLYAADDGTLGYNTAGNGFDGGNAYIYMMYVKDAGLIQFLMRIPRIQFDLQNAAAIQYWAGPAIPSPLDFTNDLNWSNSSSAALAVTSAPGSALFNVGNWCQPVFVPTINSYVMTRSASYDGHNATNWLTYSAVTPAGPWTLVFTQVNSVAGSHWYGFFPFHRNVAGNVASSAIGIKCLYSGEVGGNYQCNYSTLTLNPASGAAMVQQAFYGFTTVENPLSGGGNFTTCPTMSALKVISSGVCEATVTTTHCGAYWSGKSWPADQYVEITIGSGYTSDVTGYFIPLLRQSSSANTNYRAYIQTGVNGCFFYAIVSGTAFLLDTFTLSPAANDVWRFSVTGNVLTLSQNGTIVRTFTDTNNYVTSGSPGIDIFAATLGNEQIATFAAGYLQFAITGNAGSPGATVNYSGASSGTVIADGAGNYSIVGIPNGTYTVTPAKTGYSFSPGSQTSVVNSANNGGVNFTAQFGAGDLGPGYDFKFRL